ncbi:CYTH domain-containing protein [Gillisia sp. M10.2A]|uniref:CYTH domain-containing protein n=1 Tax=Gillisia lutea TaxID=2909668 RepID=A0ABS9ECG2_9FLAO|nr:CYTH domain-containing protein [Gillisia lutea]MCF4100547.1 CYTH domain-containing protein [Gillisia lutea]
MIEIERKFLVQSDAFKKEAFQNTRILQGYLNTDKDRSVRIRINGDKAYLTIKGSSSQSGMSRFEWEKEIAVDEAEQLLLLCEPGKIEKVRYLVKAGKFTFEIDEFIGENEGLMLAEIELTSEEDSFEKPEWLGKEVTGDVRYYNSQLSSNPYKNWKEGN